MKDLKKTFFYVSFHLITLLFIFTSCNNNNTGDLAEELAYLKADNVKVVNRRTNTNGDLTEVVEIYIKNSPYFNESQKFATLNASIIALKAYNGLKLTNYKVKIIAISNNNRPFEFEYTTKELNHINKASNTIEKFFSILKSHDFDKIPEITFNNEKEGENPFISTGQNVIEKLGEVRRFTIKGWEYHEDALIEEIGERFTIIKCHYQVEHEKEIYDDVAIDIILLNYEEAKIFSVRYKS